ncbi:MAG TPA: TetR/AcrR family transcriptional regulator [Spirochaetota bacterium]|nr:TetR/AcrR family transcriptional regulator [Spirochaetota bacterium]HPV39954.1 TetR/AcrR family transcriptional regulator [Spirochaetota bacterium]
MAHKSGKTARNRREEIIKSARQLFLKNGYRLTSIDQIAKKAGYSKRTVYLEYINKDDLFLDIATDGLEILLHQLQDIRADHVNLADYIEKYLGTITDFAFIHGDYFRLLASDVSAEVIANSTARVKKRAAEIERAGVRLLSEQIDRAIREKKIKNVDPWETSEIIIGSAVGIIVLSLGGSQTILSQEKLKIKVSRMWQVFYQGLKK